MRFTRREMLIALALSGCTRKPEKPEPTPEKLATASGGPRQHEDSLREKLAWPRTTTHAGVQTIELFPNDADEKSPLVVAIHGMGDRPQHWVEGWSHFPARAQIVLPRAFTPYGDGYSWFEYSPERTDEELGALVGAAETKLWPAVLELAAGRKVIVTGFSQGGILSFVMAARRPDIITHAFPVAGACPSALLPKNKAATAPVIAFHGTSDRMIEIKRDRDTVAAFKANGNQAELREYEGIGHTVSPQIHEDWWKALVEAVKAS